MIPISKYQELLPFARYIVAFQSGTICTDSFSFEESPKENFGILAISPCYFGTQDLNTSKIRYFLIPARSWRLKSYLNAAKISTLDSLMMRALTPYEIDKLMNSVNVEKSTHYKENKDCGFWKRYIRFAQKLFENQILFILGGIDRQSRVKRFPLEILHKIACTSLGIKYS